VIFHANGVGTGICNATHLNYRLPSMLIVKEALAKMLTKLRSLSP